MTTPRFQRFSEGAIRQQATAESFRRGENYHRQGAVISLVQRGDLLQAEVEGSQYEPYRVRVTFGAEGISEAICDCPYDWGGWCKHIVATLLACLHEPDAVEVRPTLDELLADLDREQLQGLLVHLAAHDPYLADEIESQIGLRQAIPGEADTSQEGLPPIRTSVDPRPVRRQVRNILRSLDRMRASEAYWHVGGVVDGVRRLLDQVQGFIEAGDGRNALALLEAITDEYTRGWLHLDDSDGHVSGFFQELGEAWTEAALVADLSSADREQWAHKLTQWQGELEDYEIESAFDPAQEVLMQGRE